jgi:hypothetical protein
VEIAEETGLIARATFFPTSSGQVGPLSRSLLQEPQHDDQRFLT